MRWALAIAAALSVMLAASTDVNAAAEKRRALVVSNAKYIHTAQLRNPANDATLIASKLEELGFKVQFEKDVDATRFSEIVHSFSSSLERDTEVLFYYAGHGLQFSGENFLVGIDASLKSEAALQAETFRLYTIINLLARPAGITLLFWDACRENPLADELLRITASSELLSRSQAARGGTGAVEVPPLRGTYIVYSAESSKKALDGEGDYSPFAEALARHLMTPDLELDKMFQRVTKDVQERTRQFQSPERLTKLTQDFYFRRVKQVDNDAEVNKTLRSPLSPIEKKPTTIIGINPLRTTTGPALRFRAPQANEAPTETPSVTEPRQLPPDPAPAGRGSQNVVITVDRAASTIVRRLRVSADGTLLALGDEEGMVRIIRLQDFNVIATIPAHRQRISDLDFSPDSRILLSAGRDGAIRFWDVESGRQLRELKVPGSIPYSARMHPNFPDRYVLMGDRVGKLVAWDLKRNRIITNAEFHHQRPVLSVAYQPFGRGTFFSSGGDGLLKVRLPEGRRFTVTAHKGPIFRAGYSASGKLVYTAGEDRLVKIWDASKLEGQQPKAILQGHFRYVLAADMSLDEKLLVTGGGDQALNLWNVGAGRLVGRMQGHTGDIEAVAFSPDGKLIVSASEDKSVRIWSVNNQEELAKLFFQKNGEKYAGLTFESKAFGDQNSGLISVFVDGRRVPRSDADRIVQYIGRGISIIEY
jgi:WD40 repeat protein